MTKIKSLSTFALLLTSSVAFAQVTQDARNVDGNRFRPGFSAEDMLMVRNAIVPEHLSWDAGLILNYQDDAYVLQGVRADGLIRRQGSLLKHRIDAHFVGALSLFSWVQVGLDLPVTVYQARDQDALDLGFDPLPLAGIGDIGLHAKVRILNHTQHVVDFAVIPSATFHTAAPKDAYLGEEFLTGTLELALSAPFLGLHAGGNVGVLFRDNVRNTILNINVEHELFFRVGASYDLAYHDLPPVRFDVAAELFTALKSPFQSGNIGGTELLASVGYQFSDLVGLKVGAGAGLEAAYSVPDYRVFLGLHFKGRDHDDDNDGIPNSLDRCPEKPEDMDRFEDSDGCPDTDNDQDGVLDADDGAPDDAEDKDDFEDQDGVPDLDNDQDGVQDSDDRCPLLAGLAEFEGCPDQDNDGVPDPKDQCIDQPEDKDGYEDEDGCAEVDNDGDGILDESDRCRDEFGVIENRGCPDKDRDGDGVVDRLDNCPDEPGTAANSGCKEVQRVRITAEKIEILDKVFFDSGRSTIRNVSFSLLDNVAMVLNNQPDIDMIQIEGHTDSQGAEKTNKELSQLRAEAVRNYLIGRDVNPARLSAVGFGEERPVDSNRSSRGRANNRRVEFLIVNQQAEAEVSDESSE